MMSMVDLAKRNRVRPGKLNALKQVLNLQSRVFKAAQEDELDPRKLCLLTRAFCELEERKRILRGRPLPGMLKPVAKTRTKHVNNKPLESLPDTTSTVQSSIDTALDKSMLKESLVRTLPSPPSGGVEPV